MVILLKIKNYILSTKNLAELSVRLHALIVLILLAHNAIVLLYRFNNFPIIISQINFIEIIIYCFSLILLYHKRPGLSIYTSALGIPILFSIIIFGTDATLITCLWFILAFIIIYLLLIRDARARLAYCGFCFLILFIPGILMTYSYPETIIKFVQILTFVLITLMMSYFIEHQDAKILKLNKDLKGKYKEKIELTESLKLKNEELIVFSHIMSHDLKAPLRTIKSFSALLRKEVKFENRKNAAYFQFIEESSASMDKLINDILAYYRVGSEEKYFKRVDLNQIFENIKFTYQFDLSQGTLKLNIANLPVIRADENLLNTLFQNLISNSIKFQPKGKEQHKHIIDIKSESNAREDIIYVTDNGIGIEKQFVENIFTPFRRNHNSSEYEGSGLGLSICKRVMDKHHGTITVQDTNEKGTTIALNFPKVL